MPGVATPTEAFAALAAGADALKMFPAEGLPPAVMKAWLAVLPKGTGLLPVGGITPRQHGPVLGGGSARFRAGLGALAGMHEPRGALRARALRSAPPPLGRGPGGGARPQPPCRAARDPSPAPPGSGMRFDRKDRDAPRPTAITAHDEEARRCHPTDRARCTTPAQHDRHRRPPLRRHPPPGSRVRRRFLLRRAHHRRVLPPELRRPPGPARERHRSTQTCDAAERAGFRPCKRCRPNEASQAERQAALARAACAAIDSADDPPSLAVLAQAAGLSPYHFHRVFKDGDRRHAQGLRRPPPGRAAATRLGGRRQRDVGALRRRVRRLPAGATPARRAGSA